MDRIITKLADSIEEREEMLEWRKSTLDGELFDLDVLAHESTFTIGARLGKERIAYLPVQQPLMLENLIFKPGLTESFKARAMTKLAEFAVSEAYRRDVGELYFLCCDQSTLAHADRHHFITLPGGLVVRRLTLLETFGG